MSNRSRTLLNTPINLAPNQSSVYRLFGSPFNRFVVSLIQGTIYVFLGGSVGNTPDYVFNASGTPQEGYVGTIYETQITIYNPTANTTDVNAIGTLSVMWRD